jgi:RNA polymerase sigma factor (sigma-70 family)
MQRGDEGAFETIFQRHHAPLLSYCRHTLGNRDEAEDALQQALIKAHQALLHGTAPRELRPWLYTIARNCCLSAITARRATTPLEDHTPALAGLSDQVHQREDLRELVAGIGRLPEDQRSALLLAELDDLSHQAIATIVGCEVSKVKALIYQARSALIADRDALGTPCQDIREQLSVAHGGELRRGPLRRHLKLCVGCRDFQLAVGAQRQSLGAVLPVLPSAGLAAAILGHGAAHAVGAASIGGASAGGAGVGATATGGAGIAATGTAASTAVGGASAGAGGGTGIGALVGGGVVTKLAVGGAVVALATAGAVTVHNREAHSSPHRTTRSQLAFVGAKGHRISATDIAYSGSHPALAPGSPSALAPADGAGTAGVPGAEPAVQLSGLGGAGPLLTPAATLTPGTSTPSGAALSSSGQPAVSTGQDKSGVKSGPGAQAKHRAALRRQRMLARRRALLRRLRAARRRARRKAFRHKHPAVKPAEPPVTPTPVRTPHRKGDSAPSSGAAGQPGTSAKEVKEAQAKKAREAKEARETKEAKEAEEAQEAKETREKKAREAREAKEAKEAGDTGESGSKAAAGKTSAGSGSESDS